MRLVDEQRRLRERGRIRIGYSTTNERGKKIPHKLDRFRFTSVDRATIEQVAAVYGGQAKPWKDGGRSEWEVVTDATELAVVFITGGVSFSQSREQWQGGFLVRMCDGETAHVPARAGRFRTEPCSCDLDGEPVCKKTTHLGLILPHLPGLGVWRLVTHGQNAAEELAGNVELIESAFAAGLHRVQARLTIEFREKRRIVDDKPVVRKFPVPVLDLDTSVAALGGPPPPSLPPSGAAIGGGRRQAVAALPAGTGSSPPVPVGWEPVDQAALPETPVPDVREQLAAVHNEPKRRKNSPPPLPATGLAPRPAAQADADRTTCARCREPLAGAAVERNPDGPGWVHKNCAGDDTGPASGPVDVAEAPPDPAASQEQAPGRGGTSSGDTGAAAEPVPAGTATATKEAPAKNPPGYRRGMTAAQHRKVFALMADAFPAWEGATGPDVDAFRKQAQLDIARWAGAPADIASRNDIPHAVGSPLIDALQRLADGQWAYAEGRIFDTVTGELVEFQEEP
jgi:hypothetical protein